MRSTQSSITWFFLALDFTGPVRVSRQEPDRLASMLKA